MTFHVVHEAIDHNHQFGSGGQDALTITLSGGGVRWAARLVVSLSDWRGRARRRAAQTAPGLLLPGNSSVPGLKVCARIRPRTPRALLTSAIRDPNPVVSGKRNLFQRALRPGAEARRLQAVPIGNAKVFARQSRHERWSHGRSVCPTALKPPRNSRQEPHPGPRVITAHPAGPGPPER